MTEAKHDLDLPIEIPIVDTEDEFDPRFQWAGEVDLSAEADGACVVVGQPDSVQPSERVRFTAPVKIRRESAEDVVDGVIHNLSPHGAACGAAQTLRTGERVWLRFQLTLAQDPIKLLCEVIWCRERQQESFFGLHFLSLTADEEAAIRQTVVERSEGRAGDWALPVIPATETSEHRTASPILTAAAGMAAGITLALALSVIPSAISGDSESAAPTVRAEATQAVASSAAQAKEPAARAESEPERGDLGPAAQTPPVPERKSAPAAQPQQIAGVEPEAKSRLLPRIQTSAPAPAGDVLRPLGTDDGMELALLADGDVHDHVSFWLDNPKRLVVDVFGRKSGFERKSYRIEHPLADQLRVGNHPGKVRFVIDTTGRISSRVSTKPVGSSLVVTLHRG